MKNLPLFLVSARSLWVAPLQARIWTSADGTRKTEAELVGGGDGKVTFQTPGGKVEHTEIPGGSHGNSGRIHQNEKHHE